MSSRFSLFNDPVHGFVSVPKGLILGLVETPEVQRLRRIRQLGLGYLVFPGAVHTRFEHGLGAMALLQSALDTLREKGAVVTTDELDGALAAALLHDALVAGRDDPTSYVSTAGHEVDRVEADRIFRDAMADTGTGVIRRWIVWTAVTVATIFVGRAVPWTPAKHWSYRVAAAVTIVLARRRRRRPGGYDEAPLDPADVADLTARFARVDADQAATQRALLEYHLRPLVVRRVPVR